MSLLNNIRNHTVTIAVVGAGYVGLPLALEMAKLNKVILFDIDESKVLSIKNKKSYIIDITDEAISSAIDSNMLIPSCDEEILERADCYIICVPTPLNKNKQPELRYIISATQVVSKHIKRNALIILESTTFPGTTEEVVKPILEQYGKQYGKDFYLAFSPERVDPGNKVYNTANTPKIVGGVCAKATDLAKAVYEENLNCNVFTVSSPAVAEMSKILENTYRNINIGLIDEFAKICYRMNIDIWEVIEAAKTKPFGFHAFYPGPGVGGHCIPLDPFYLAWKVKEFGISASMIETSGNILDSMTDYVLSRITDLLNDANLPVAGSRILIIGVAYKADINDCRESPALDIISKLKVKKASVFYYDPYVSSVSIENEKMKSLTIQDVVKEKWDIVVVVTDHSSVDYEKIIETKSTIFDTRNALKKYKASNIVKL